MSRKDIKRHWDTIISFLSKRFDDREMDLNKIVYLIGIQEIGRPKDTFKKSDKINLMHVGICTILEPYGYYEFEGIDTQGWPHFILRETLPKLSHGEQTLLMKEAVVEYFLRERIIH